jgi:hypothetical protein
MYGKKHSKNTLKKLSDNAHIMIGKENPVSRAVVGVHLKTKEILNFESANKAANYFNLFNNSHIIASCQGRRKSCQGYKWLYKEDFSQDKINDIIDKSQKIILKGIKHPNSLKVIGYSMDENKSYIFNNISEASFFRDGFDATNISRVCKRIQLHTNHFL